MRCQKEKHILINRSTSIVGLHQKFWPAGQWIIICNNSFDLFHGLIDFRRFPKTLYNFSSIIKPSNLQDMAFWCKQWPWITRLYPNRSYLGQPAWTLNSKLHSNSNKKTRYACSIKHCSPPTNRNRPSVICLYKASQHQTVCRDTRTLTNHGLAQLDSLT